MIRKGLATKPTYAASIDWSDPITIGLVFFCLFDEVVPRDLVTGARGAPTNSPILRHSPDGLAASLNGAPYFDFGHNPLWNVTGASSLLWRGQIATGSAFHSFGNKTDTSGATTNPFEWRTDNAATPAIRIIRSNTSYREFGGPAVSVGVLHTLIGTFSDGDVTTIPNWMIDGVYSSGTYVSGTATGATTGDASRLRLGRRADGATPLNGQLSVFGIWNRALTGNEQQTLCASPFSLLRVPVTRTHMGASVSSSINVNLTGAAAAGGAGSFTPSLSVLSLGVGAAASAGTFGPSVAAGPIGVTSTGNAGSLATSLGSNASGVASTGAAGTFGPTVSNAELGVAGTGSAGTLGVGGFFNGTSASGAAGNFTPSIIVAAMGGVSGTATAGVLAASLSASGIGVAGTGGVGSLGASPGTTLTGVVATGAAGLFSLMSSPTLTLTGVQSTGLAGTLLAQVGNLGSGKRRVTGSLDVRRVSGVASRVNRATARDTRRITASQDD